MQILISLVAILALVALAWWLGFRASPVLTDAQALLEADAVLPGFGAVSAVLAEGGRGALVRGADGSLAAVLPLADGWVARRLPHGQPIERLASGLRLAFGEPMLHSADLPVPNPLPPWLEARIG